VSRDKVIDRIITLVAERYSLSRDDIFGHSKNRHLITARREIAYAMRVQLKMSYPQIGNYLNRDHTTIIHGLRNFVPTHPINVELAFGYDGAKPEALNLLKNGYYVVNEGGRWARLYRERSPKCEIIGCGFDDVLEVHHLISKKTGGSDDTSNLIIVCPNHHTMIHQGLVKLKPAAFPHLTIPLHLSTPSCVDVDKTMVA